MNAAQLLRAGDGRQHRATAASRLLTLVHRRGPLTRADLTTELGLARSAIGTALDELLDLGLIHIGQQARPANVPTTRGRPSPEVSVRPDGPVAVAVQLSRGRIQAAAIGLGQAVEDLHAPVPLGETSPDAAIEQVARLVADLRERSARPVAGIGVAMPGFVRASDGFLLSSLHLGWSDIPLASWLTELIPDAPPVVVGRSSGLAALAEFHYGAGRGAVNLLGLNCEHVGIGGGLIADRRPLAGAGQALEAGHVIVESSGRPCPCGATGCLELYADGRSFLRAAGVVEDDLRAAHAEVDRRLAAAGEGERVAVEAVRTTSGHLATGLSTLINVLNPDRVVLTGFLAELHRASGGHIDREVARRSIVARAGRTTIVAGALPHPALHGAAELALGPLLSDPSLAGRLAGGS